MRGSDTIPLVEESPPLQPYAAEPFLPGAPDPPPTKLGWQIFLAAALFLGSLIVTAVELFEEKRA
jgi:hypothetical protein